MVDGIEFNWNDTINKYNDIDIKIKNQLLAAASSIFDLRSSKIFFAADFGFCVFCVGVGWCCVAAAAGKSLLPPLFPGISRQNYQPKFSAT